MLLPHLPTQHLLAGTEAANAHRSFVLEIAGVTILHEVRIGIYPLFEDASRKFFPVDFQIGHVRLWGWKEDEIQLRGEIVSCSILPSPYTNVSQIYLPPPPQISFLEQVSHLQDTPENISTTPVFCVSSTPFLGDIGDHCMSSMMTVCWILAHAPTNSNVRVPLPVTTTWS